MKSTIVLKSFLFFLSLTTVNAFAENYIGISTTSGDYNRETGLQLGFEGNNYGSNIKLTNTAGDMVIEGQPAFIKLKQDNNSEFRVGADFDTTTATRSQGVFAEYNHYRNSGINFSVKGVVGEGVVNTQEDRLTAYGAPGINSELYSAMNAVELAVGQNFGNNNITLSTTKKNFNVLANGGGEVETNSVKAEWSTLFGRKKDLEVTASYEAERTSGKGNGLEQGSLDVSRVGVSVVKYF